MRVDHTKILITSACEATVYVELHILQQFRPFVRNSI